METTDQGKWLPEDEYLSMSQQSTLVHPASPDTYIKYTIQMSDRIVSTLYLQQYLLDPFHIYTSYQATSEGVLRVNLFQN